MTSPKCGGEGIEITYIMDTKDARKLFNLTGSTERIRDEECVLLGCTTHEHLHIKCIVCGYMKTKLCLDADKS